MFSSLPDRPNCARFIPGEQIVDELERELNDSWLGQHWGIDILKQSEVRNEQDGETVNRLVEFKCPRERFISGGQQAFNFVEGIIQPIRAEGNVFLLELIFDGLETFESCQSEEELRPVVQRALKELRQRGKTPSAVFIPFELRWADLLSESGNFHDEFEPSQKGHGYLTTVDGTPVFGFRELEKDILVLDLAATYELLKPRDPAIKISVIDRFLEECQVLLQEVESSDDLPQVESREIPVLLQLEIQFGIKAVALDAALRVSCLEPLVPPSGQR
ncbi:hypothetical protein [Blastopirellula marina]|uniref:Uncharacterized protein n=1 Tax=Blastopirellula marina DSM 3645 TaxID=314230 RepID=A3ZM06_9BACT|nr:hypothetical protein [Blastopirellula marina]EAQ82789.1 hypothetical protein DSM3645_10327 [Blastopirellula marina DSM 3645]